MPFRFEGQRRNEQAREGLAKWDADRLVTVRLDDLIIDRKKSIRAAFELADVEVAKIVGRIASKAHVVPAG
jgi:cell division GTPase FtsZ